MTHLLIIDSGFSTHPQPFPQRGKGDVDVLNRKEKLQSFYLVLTGMVFLGIKSRGFAGCSFLPCKGGLRWVLNKM